MSKKYRQQYKRRTLPSIVKQKEKTKSFIKKVYNRKITKDDYKDIIEALFE